MNVKRMILKSFSLLLFTTLLFVAKPTDVVKAAFDEYWVAADGDCGGNSPCTTSIQTAINNVADGGTVYVEAGTYTVPSNTHLFQLSDGKKLLGAGADVTILQGDGTREVISISSDSVLDGFKITGGVGHLGNGGGMNIHSGTPTISNCVFVGNYASNSGGAIYIDGGSPVINDCTFLNNESGTQAGAILFGGDHLELTGCSFDGNTSTGGGALVFNPYKTATLRFNSFDSNTASNGPSELRAWSGSEVDALYNWWGSADGPSVGIKDQVYPESAVDYEPWCTEETCSFPVENVTQGTYFTSIQDAIDAASDGDTIEVSPGTYNESLTLNVPNITVQSTDGADVTIIDVPDGDLTTGVQVLADMGTVTFDGFTVMDFTENGIVQGMSASEGTTFHVLNNIVIPAADYLRNGIQVTGDGSTVIGNYIEGAYLTEDWASTAIGVVNASNVLVQDNEVSGAVNGVDGGICVYTWGEYVSNGNQVINNVIYNADYPLTVEAYDGGTTSDVELHQNKVTNYEVALQMWTDEDPASIVGYVDATQNWWGSEYGPLSAIEGEADIIQWCADETCTTFLPDEENVIELSGDIGVDGGISINVSGLTILLTDGTVIENDSPCFVINADNTTIKAESVGGATCVATSGSSGIEVADGVTGVTIEGLEITGDGSADQNGIEFLGAITNLQIVDNFIHDLTGDGVFFTEQPVAETSVSFYIQGNLFKDNGGVGVNNSNGTSAIDATYNAWGDVDVPTGTDGDGVSANVTYEPYTHVNLYLESSGTPWADQVVSGETITYTVKADLVNVTAAEFTITYPTDLLSNPSITEETDLFDPVPGGAALTSVGSGEIVFSGYSDTAVTGEDITLFSVTFDAIATGTGKLAFDEDTDVFGMSPGYGPSSNVYADSLEDQDAAVIALPEMSSDDIQGYYLSGEPRDFSVRTLNPTDGAEYTNVLFRYIIYSADLDDISSFTYAGGDVPMSEDGNGNLTGYFGPSGGFPMNNDPYDVTTIFNIEFNNPGDYEFSITLVDLSTEPETILTTLTSTAAVYDPPTLSSTTISGPFMSGEEEEFSVNLTNPSTGIETNVYVVITMTGVTPDDIDSLMYWEVQDSSWHDLSYEYDEGTSEMTIRFGPAEGFLMSKGYNVDALFKVVFDTNDNFEINYEAALYDYDSDPDRSLTEMVPGTAVVYANFDITGTVSMQGRTVRSGVPMTLSGIYDDYSVSSTNLASFNVSFVDVIADTYEITTLQPRYLNVTTEIEKLVLVSGEYVIPALELKGGNADWTDNEINISDASKVGTHYGQSGDQDADVNFDEKVNVQDLALVGGNFDLTSEEAYADWLGSVAGQITTSDGVVTGTVTGDYDLTITGQVTEYVGNEATFTGTVTGDLEGDVTATINDNGIDTLYGIVTGTGATSTVRIIGTFPQTGVDGDFQGRVIIGDELTPVTSIVIVGGDSVAVGEELQLSVNIDPEEATDEVIWSIYVDDSAIAVIDEETGIVTGLQAGTATIIVKTLDDSNLSDAVKTITVTTP